MHFIRVFFSSYLQLVMITWLSNGVDNAMMILICSVLSVITVLLL